MEYGTILIDLFVRLGKPIQSSTTSRLPFETEGVWCLEMFRDQLLHGTNSIGLEGLFFIPCYRLSLLGFTKVGSVEEGVE